MGFKSSKEHSPSPWEATSVQVGFILFFLQPLDDCWNLLLPCHSQRKRTLPALYQSWGQRSQPLTRTPGRAASVPATPPSLACGLEPLWLLPLPAIFHLPSPPPLPSTPIPTINENQKEGEVGAWKSNSFLIYRSPPEDQGKVWSLPWSEEQSSHRGQGPGWARPVTLVPLISPAVQLGKSWATMKTRCYIRRRSLLGKQIK